MELESSGVEGVVVLLSLVAASGELDAVSSFLILILQTHFFTDVW